MKRENYIEVAVARETKPDLVSRIIMWVMRVNYSHIVTLYKGRVHHSVGGGVGSEPIDKFLKDHTFEVRQKVKLTVSTDYLDGYLKGSEGKKYSKKQYIGFVFPSLRKYFRNGRKETICSEFEARLLNQNCSYEILDPDFKTPRQVMNHVVRIERAKVMRSRLEKA